MVFNLVDNIQITSKNVLIKLMSINKVNREPLRNSLTNLSIAKVSSSHTFY